MRSLAGPVLLPFAFWVQCIISSPLAAVNYFRSRAIKKTQEQVLSLPRCKGFEPLAFWSVAKRSIQLS